MIKHKQKTLNMDIKQLLTRRVEKILPSREYRALT